MKPSKRAIHLAKYRPYSAGDIQQVLDATKGDADKTFLYLDSCSKLGVDPMGTGLRLLRKKYANNENQP